MNYFIYVMALVEEESFDINASNDRDWAEIRELPGHKRDEPVQNPNDPFYDPTDNRRYVERARIIGGHPVLDSHFTDGQGHILPDPDNPERRNRWVEVRGNGAADGWTPIKRDQKLLDQPPAP